MNTLRLPFLPVLAFICFAGQLSAQNALVLNDEVAEISSSPKNHPAPLNPYRFHKKLPYSYEGYAIEVIASNYPLTRTNPVFRQFGNYPLRQTGTRWLLLSHPC